MNPGRRLAQRPDRRNAIADNPDVAAEPRRAGAVDDSTVRKENIKPARRLLRTGDNNDQDTGRQK